MANEVNEVRERMASDGDAASLSNADLLKVVTGKEIACPDVTEIAWSKLQALVSEYALTESQAIRLSAAFELGRRAAWVKPQRGDRCLSPDRVYELMRDVAQGEVEGFWVIMLDVRGRLVRRHQVALGSVSQCPVSPRDLFRSVIREACQSVILVHNHPSGDPTPSPDDADLTERLRCGAELLGVVVRDHVIVAASGFYSFVESGRWRR